ncbi:MAG: DUF2117 domain-containing protein [Methanoregula sp.]|nr:DUF2117 domain-containing protein [Methanoregula sp.]
MNMLLNTAVMVVHGPELFDQGDVAWLLDLLCPQRIIVAGVMARTAAEESGLPLEFNAQPPSRVILAQEDPVFLANRGKTAETGELFGNIVASRLGDHGLVHLECSNRIVYCWNGGDEELAGLLSRRTGFEKKSVRSSVHHQENIRQIRGCIPGEAVYVNGIVIGRATADVVTIRNAGGIIEPCSGLDPKPHGLEKLSAGGDVDISTAWCKSGPVRLTQPQTGDRASPAGRVLVIDHCGHEIYRRMPEDCCGVLAIGDDTTAVCGHICTHRGIPVLGIVDGDRDVIVPSAFAPGSVVVEVLHERDDDVGREIASTVPDTPVFWDVWVQGILEILGGRIRVVIDQRKPE